MEDPTVEPSDVSVSIAFPGGSAEEVESGVVDVLEESLYGLEGVVWVEASAEPNVARFHLKFVDGTAMDLATEQVRGKILSKRQDLSPDVRDPVVWKWTTAFTAQMVFAVSGARALGVLSDAARDLKDELSQVAGVASVELRGERTRAVVVHVDPQHLGQHGLTIDSLVEHLRAANLEVPAGTFKVGSFETMLRVERSFHDARSVGQLPVASRVDEQGTEQIVSLEDVADVEEGAEHPHEFFVQRGKPAVGLEVRFRAGANAVVVGERLRRRVRELEARLPELVKVETAYDQPAFVEESVDSFGDSLAEGILLVMAVIALGMGFRPALVVAAVLPLSVGGAVLGLYLLGGSLEQMSIAGLIIATGLLVDDAVVVTESIQLMRDRGLGKVRAAVLGTSRVFWANNATTGVACAAFIPLFFIGGGTGEFVRSLPLVVILALGVSLLIAQVVTPWLSTLILVPRRGVTPVDDAAGVDPAADAGDSEDEEKNWLFRGLKRVFSAAVPFVVRRPVLVIACASLLLAGSVALIPRLGIQFFPKSDKPILFVNVRLPRGSSIETTAERYASLSRILSTTPGVESTSAVIGAGYPRIFVGRAQQAARPDVVEVLVHVADGERSAELAPRLRTVLARVPGIATSVEELFKGPSVSHPVLLRITGDDYAELAGYAEAAKAMLRSIPGTLNVSDSLNETVPVTSVVVQAEREARYGVGVGGIARSLRRLYAQDKVTEFRSGRENVGLVIEAKQHPDSPLELLADSPIARVDGADVPLSALANVRVSRGQAALKKRNLRRFVEVWADVAADVLPSRVVKQLRPRLAQLSLKPGYSVTFAGEQEETEKSFRALGFSALGAVLVIGTILLLIFDSLTLTAVIGLAIPFALIGAVSALAIASLPFGFMPFLGLIALIGVYVNHKIYFVDRVHVLMQRGVSWDAAIKQAGLDRIRPVVLTALTAVLGLVPLTVSGGSLWTGFGLVNILGLIASIPLSLILLPAFLAIALRRTRSNG